MVAKKRWIAGTLAAIALSGWLGYSNSLSAETNNSPTYSIEYSIEEDTKIEDPLKNIDMTQDISTIALDLESKYWDILDSCYTKSENITKTAIKKMGNTRTFSKFMSTTDSVLRDDFGYVDVESVTLLSSMICDNLKEIKKEKINRKDCDTGSFLYLSAGEQQKLPVKAVLAPGHMFIRWGTDGKKHINWETRMGKIKTDDYYIKNLNISQTAIDNGVYMKSLTKKQLVGVIFSNIGHALNKEEKYKEAIKNYNKAIYLHPQHAEAYSNRGSTYTDLMSESLIAGKHEEGIDYYQKAIRDYHISIWLNPHNTAAFTNIGMSLTILDMNKEAIINYDKALKIEPNNPKTLNNKCVALNGLKKYREAIKECSRAINIDPSNPKPYKNISTSLYKIGMIEKSNKVFALYKKIMKND